MKKIIASILVATVSLGLFSCGNGDTPTTEDPVNTDESSSQTTDSSVQPPDTQNPLFVGVTEGFDDKNIVLQFGAVSDIHTSTSAGTVQHALEVLKETALLYTEKGIEAVVVAGDLTNAYTSDQATKIQEATQVKEVYEKVFDPAEVPMIFALGNHDLGRNLRLRVVEHGALTAHGSEDRHLLATARGKPEHALSAHLLEEPLTRHLARGREHHRPVADNCRLVALMADGSPPLPAIGHPRIHDTCVHVCIRLSPVLQ